jgi:hypothetical protein
MPPFRHFIILLPLSMPFRCRRHFARCHAAAAIFAFDAIISLICWLTPFSPPPICCRHYSRFIAAADYFSPPFFDSYFRFAERRAITLMLS